MALSGMAKLRGRGSGPVAGQRLGLAVGLWSAARGAVRWVGVAVSAGLAAGAVHAVEVDRLPVEMLPTTVQLSFSASHAAGTTSSQLAGFPQRFDVRLGSLDMVVLDYAVRYDLPDLQYAVLAEATSGSARIDTLLSIDVGQWLIDSTGGPAIGPITQDIWHSATCGLCVPGVGSFGAHGFDMADTEILKAAVPLSTGLRYQLDGTIPVVATTVNSVINMRLSGDYTWAGQLTVVPTYWAFTTRQYLDNAVARTTPDMGWYDRSEAVAAEMVHLRNLDAATSSRNLALRSAEYAIMSFWAAQQWVMKPSFETLVGFWFQGPFGVAGHNAIKACKEASGACARLFDLIQGRKPTDLPGTPPGGTIGSGIGWVHGIVAPDDLDGLGLAVEAGTAELVAPAQRFEQDGVQGLFNYFTTGAIGEGQQQRLPELSTGLHRMTQPVADGPSQDPSPQLTFIVLALENSFSAFALPDVGGVQQIGGFSLVLDGVVYQLHGNKLHDLVALTGHSVDSFTVVVPDGLHVPDRLLVDVVFAQSGGAELMQLSLLQAVPEVPSAALLSVGLVALWAATNRRGHGVNGSPGAGQRRRVQAT